MTAFEHTCANHVSVDFFHFQERAAEPAFHDRELFF